MRKFPRYSISRAKTKKVKMYSNAKGIHRTARKKYFKRHRRMIRSSYKKYKRR